MRICTNAKQFRKAIKDVQPSKIAVAFVGNGWKQYVSKAHLKEIILSPTVGSNPKAIEEIVNWIGFRNVYFLDDLHSKIYLGTESAILGSANLSKNGFADNGLFEAGVVLAESTDLKKLSVTFEEYKASAIRQYPTEKSKKDKLLKLMEQWQKLVWHNLNLETDGKASPSINDYKSNLDRIHIVWYQPDKLNYNEEAINGIVPDAAGFEPDKYFSNSFMFHKDDSLKAGDWILGWHCRDDGKPRKDGKIHWVHVHHVIPNGVHDDTYTKLGCEAKGLLTPAPPFSLDNLTKKLIRDALDTEKFPELLSLNDDNVWKLAPADNVVSKFLKYLQKEKRDSL